MKKMTALAAILLLPACGSEPTVGNDAVAATANETSTAVPAGMPAAVETAATSTVSPAPMDASVGNAGGEEKTRVQELAGNWRVTGVSVASGPVQAVSDNDPELMGAVLSISPERLAWKPHKGGFFTDTCSGPQIGPDDSIGCAEGQFGPPGGHLTSEDTRLRLDWYNGAILTLSRQQSR